MSCGVTAGWSAVPVTGWNVRRAVKTSGCSPDCPKAARSLSVLIDAELPERLLADHPRAADLRIRGEVEVLTERAVVVHTHCTCQEYAVVQSDLLLPVETDRRVREEVLTSLPGRGSSGDLEARRRELEANHLARANPLLVVLTAERRAGDERFREVELRGSAVVSARVGDVAQILLDLTLRARRREQRLPLHGHEVLEVLIVLGRLIEPGDESLREPADRPVVERAHSR